MCATRAGKRRSSGNDQSPLQLDADGGKSSGDRLDNAPHDAVQHLRRLFGRGGGGGVGGRIGGGRITDGIGSDGRSNSRFEGHFRVFESVLRWSESR